MAIFTNTVFSPVVEQAEDIFVDNYPHIMPTVESAYEIATEGYGDIYKLVSGLYITDAMIEDAVREGAEAEPLIENSVKDFAAKVVAKFKELGAKIANWFKKILENIKIRLTGSKEFVAKYKDAIIAKSKAVKEFKPKHHEFKTEVKKIVGEHMAAVVAFAKADSDKRKVDDDFTANMVKKVASKATTIGEMKSAVQEELIGKEVETVINASAVAAMIKYCENINTALAQLEDLKNANAKHIDAIIKDINSSGKTVELINAKTRCYNAAMSAVQALNAIAVGTVNKINAEYVSILRSLMLTKVESAGEELLSESSIFESAMNLI